LQRKEEEEGQKINSYGNIRKKRRKIRIKKENELNDSGDGIHTHEKKNTVNGNIRIDGDKSSEKVGLELEVKQNTNSYGKYSHTKGR
jgi:hypothetical protein